MDIAGEKLSCPRSALLDEAGAAVVPLPRGRRGGGGGGGCPVQDWHLGRHKVGAKGFFAFKFSGFWVEGPNRDTLNPET